MSAITERDHDILRRRLAGETLKSIAAAHGIERKAVKAVVAAVEARVLESARWHAEKAARLEAAAVQRANARVAAAERRALEATAQRERERLYQLRVVMDTLRGKAQVVEPHWRSLAAFGDWVQGISGANVFTQTPEYEALFGIINAWYTGRANDTATVGRIRRLAERGEVPEGLVA